MKGSCGGLLPIEGVFGVHTEIKGADRAKFGGASVSVAGLILGNGQVLEGSYGWSYG